jgi:hypothetical protein
MKLVLLYDLKDAEIVDKLIVHLNSLEKGNNFKLWYLDKVLPGEETLLQKEAEIIGAEIIMVCISANYLANPNFETDLSIITKAQLNNPRIHILNVLVSPCVWDIAKLKEFKVFPENGEPLTSNTWKSIDFPITQITYYIKGLSESNDNLVENKIINKIIDSEKKKELQSKKHAFLYNNSEIRQNVGAEYTELRSQITNLFNKIESNSSSEIIREIRGQYCVFTFSGFSLSIFYDPKYLNSTSQDFLVVKIFNKPISKKRQMYYLDGDPEEINTITYTVDADQNLNLGWKNSENEFIPTSQLSKKLVDLFISVALSNN